MPSLGCRFGGNGDLIGAWFKQSVQSAMFESAPVLGRFKVDGHDIPFVGMWALAGIGTVPLLPGWKKKLAKTVPLIGMGADTGKATVRFEKGRLEVDYDQKLQPISKEIRGSVPRARNADRFEDLGVEETDHRSRLGRRLPRRQSRVWRRRSQRRGLRQPGPFRCGCGGAAGRRRDASVTHNRGMGSPCRRPSRTNHFLKYQGSASTRFQYHDIIKLPIVNNSYTS